MADTTTNRLNPRAHLAWVLEAARTRMLVFLAEARRVGWLALQHCDDRWPWPSLTSATVALQGGGDPATVQLGSAEQYQKALTGQLQRLEEAVTRTLDAGHRLPLVELAQAFRLEPFDVDVLGLALAAELDPAFRAGLQLWRREPDTAALDVDTAIQLLGSEPGPSELSIRRAFEPRRPLVADRLLELGPRPEGRRALVRIADSVLRFVLGDPTVGDDVQEVARYLPVPPDPLSGTAPPPALADVYERLVSTFAAPSPRPIAFHVLGPDGSARRSVVQAALARLRRPQLAINAAALVPHRAQLGDLLRRIRRDAILTGAVIHIHIATRSDIARVEDSVYPEPAAFGPPAQTGRNNDSPTPVTIDEQAIVVRAIEHHLALAPTHVVVTGPIGTALFAGSRQLMGGSTRRLAKDESSHVMRAVLGPHSPAQEIRLREVIESFTLTAGDLAYACRTALLDADVHGQVSPGTDELVAALVKACQQRTHSELTSFAERIQTRSSWSDVIVADDIKARLQELVSFAQHQHAVFYEWGFDASMPTGRALTALFAGPSGTGKSLVAGVIAKELNRALYRVDLSRIVSKYIGETERQLGKVFDEAERERAVLLFDEADSIFSKRTEVQSSNDRYANATVNYLLQRLDTFEGVAILTTNHKDAMDGALKRRIKYHIEFKLPDQQAREFLWETNIPHRAPIGDNLDLVALGRAAQLSGASIRNAVLRACLHALSENSPLEQRHLMAAVKGEAAHLGMLVRIPEIDPHG